MSFFSKRDLKFQYDWNVTLNHSKSKDTADVHQFSKHEGEEVMSLIREFCKKNHMVTRGSVHRAESVISRKVPETITTTGEALAIVETYW